MKLIFILLCLIFLGLFLWLAPRTQNAQTLQSQKPAPLTVIDQDNSVELIEHLKAQLEVLDREQESRTVAQQKIDSHLLFAAKRRRNEALAPVLATLQTNVTYDTEGRTEVDISGQITDNLLAAITHEGGEVVSSYPEFNTLRARVKPE